MEKGASPLVEPPYMETPQNKEGATLFRGALLLGKGRHIWRFSTILEGRLA